ncbi:hypothetical protein BOX15_Mlig010014g1, partial [Macrostomum lignano]
KRGKKGRRSDNADLGLEVCYSIQSAGNSGPGRGSQTKPVPAKRNWKRIGSQKREKTNRSQQKTEAAKPAGNPGYPRPTLAGFPSTKMSDPDLQANFQRYKPPPIRLLAQRSKFSERELRLLYRGFKQDCPTGLVREEHICGIFAQLFPFGNPAPFARIIFNWLDVDKKESLPFHQYVMWLSELARGSVEEKIVWIFRLYDVNLDGTLSHEEICQFLASIYELLGSHARKKESAKSVHDHASQIFHQMDTEGKGSVTYEDFQRYCHSSPVIMKGLEVFDTCW